MKNVSLIVIASSMSLLSCAQNITASQAPAVVLNTFQTMYPKAADVEWERKGKDFEVEFETGLQGSDHNMLIDSTGKVVFHKQDISKSDLPQAVTAHLDKEFAGYRIEDVEKVEDNRKNTYKVEIKKAGEEWKLIFDDAGKLIQKTSD